MSDRPCLHCALLEVIHAHADEQRDGEPLIDGPRVLSALGRVAAQIIASHDEGAEQVVALTVHNNALVAGLNAAGLEARGSVGAVDAKPPTAH